MSNAIGSTDTIAGLVLIKASKEERCQNLPFASNQSLSKMAYFWKLTIDQNDKNMNALLALTASLSLLHFYRFGCLNCCLLFFSYVDDNP